MVRMEINTEEQYQIIDITYDIEAEVAESDIKEGLCIVTIPHVSAGLIFAEDEEGIKLDYLSLLDQLVPPPSEQYHHNLIDTNAEAQLKAILLGSNQIIPIIDGKLSRGRWQKILFIELDGPRERTVNVMIIKK